MNEGYETATLAGGCFWCTEAIFKRLKGVYSVIPGYTGGKLDNPTYEQVSSGKSGHAEAIEVKFDPKQVSFAKILDIFWVMHDPTTLNCQGPDVGTQYRSAIFYHNENQKKQAELSKKEVEINYPGKKIVTAIEPFKHFYRAEEFHQDYYDKYKDTNAYCWAVINPKLQKLLDRFNKDVKEEYK